MGSWGGSDLLVSSMAEFKSEVSISEERQEAKVDKMPDLHTTVEEREYGTVPGSEKATRVALDMSLAQGNPTVERGPSKGKKTKKKGKIKKGVVMQVCHD